MKKLTKAQQNALATIKNQEVRRINGIGNGPETYTVVGDDTHLNQRTVRSLIDKGICSITRFNSDGEFSRYYAKVIASAAPEESAPEEECTACRENGTEEQFFTCHECGEPACHECGDGLLCDNCIAEGAEA